MADVVGESITHVDFHRLVQPVAQHEVVRHAQPVRLHGVVCPIVHLPKLTCTSTSQITCIVSSSLAR